MANPTEALTGKIMGMPGWTWLLLGVGVFFVFSRNKQSPTSANYTMTTPTSDQMTSNAINDLKNTLTANQQTQQQEENDRFAEIISKNAQQQSDWADALHQYMLMGDEKIQAVTEALAGLNTAQQQQNDQIASMFQQLSAAESDNQNAMQGSLSQLTQQYQDMLNQSNSNFLQILQQALSAIQPSGAPATANTPAVPVTNNPASALPQWVQNLLQDPAQRNRMYLQNPNFFIQSDGPYGTALNEFLRTDTVNGLNTTGQTQQGWGQLQMLLNMGQVYANPYMS